MQWKEKIVAIDPVCHMQVDGATAQWTSQYYGRIYYFCVPGCKQAFKKDPEKIFMKSRNMETLMNTEVLKNNLPELE